MKPKLSDVQIPTEDGVALAGTLAMPPGPPRRVVVIGSALAVPRRLYAPFSRFLAASGVAALSFDYRGFGGSGPPWRIETEGGMRAIGERDMAAALRFAAQVEGVQRVDLVAHSFSLMLFGMAPNRRMVSRVVSVASGSPHFGLQPFPRNLLYLFLWGVIIPRSARVHGYFPGKNLGLVGDMPEAVARDVALACHRRGAFRPELQDWDGDLWAIGVADDQISPPAAVDDMHAGFVRARLRRSEVAPAELGVKEIGHYGAFLPMASALWARMAAWLEEGPAAASPRPAGGSSAG